MEKQSSQQDAKNRLNTNLKNRTEAEANRDSSIEQKKTNSQILNEEPTIVPGGSSED